MPERDLAVVMSTAAETLTYPIDLDKPLARITGKWLSGA